MESLIWETAEELDKNLALRVRKIRKRRKISQQKLADLSGIKPHCDNPNDAITVTMKDGSVFSSEGSEDTDILSDTDFITMSFNRVIDINKAESISFAGEIYKMN